MEDTRRLIPISIKKLEDNLWNIKIDAGEFYNVEGSLDEIKRALRRIKAKDGAEYGKCRSSKKGTYSSMVGEGDDNLHKINVWKSKVPHSPEEFKKLMEAVIMKQIKLTKNYLIEGEVVPKGTVVQLKEKLEFLPTDIWNVAKDMDESERFEYVKAELKKIGDDSTDEEIKAFLDKYKKDLNESLKEDNEEYEPYVNVDNLHFGYNTKYGFIEHEFSKNLIIKNNGKDKTFIFGQLPSKEWAYVVTDVLKGEGGLLEYDVSFKKDVVYYAFKDILEDNGIQESLKESVEGLGDMLDMIEETLKSEDKIDPKNFDKILDIASGDDELLNAWVDWCNASDAKFNKKANKFWEVFDKLCKPYAKGKAKGDDKSKDKKDEE